MEKSKFKIVFLSFMLILAMCGLYAEEEVFTEGDFKYTVENGQASITSYTGNDEILIISEKLGGYEVISIGDSAFLGCFSLTTIKIPDSVISIGDSVFWGCSSLTTLEIPDSVISIGDSAFSFCSKLTTLEIPDSVTSIGNSAFSNCKNLTTLAIPNSVTSIGEGAFRGCKNLTSIRVNENHPVYSFTEGVLFDKEQKLLHTYLVSNSRTAYAILDSVSRIGDSAFFGCFRLITLEIPNSVTSIGEGVFDGCENLTTLAIPNSVTSIEDGAFVECESLTVIRVTKNHPVYSFIEGVLFDKQTKILHTYLGSHKRISYVIPDSITGIGYGAFAFSYNLVSLEIPDSVISIGNSAFEDCESLTTIEIPDSVASIGKGAFDGCENVIFTIENEDSYLHKYALENNINYVFRPDTSWLN